MAPIIVYGLEFDLKSILADDNGCNVLLNAMVQSCISILANVYTPNKVQEQSSFFKELQQKLPFS